MHIFLDRREGLFVRPSRGDRRYRHPLAHKTALHGMAGWGPRAHSRPLTEGVRRIFLDSAKPCDENHVEQDFEVIRSSSR
jgi:hypothetical protein